MLRNGSVCGSSCCAAALLLLLPGAAESWLRLLL
jgi:hypothetical protein